MLPVLQDDKVCQAHVGLKSSLYPIWVYCVLKTGRTVVFGQAIAVEGLHCDGNESNKKMA